MEFPSSVVMAYVLRFCQTHQPEIEVNRTKAQKLLYCCYGTVMAQFDQRLTDEHPKKWPFGPVFPRTFNDIKKGRLSVAMARQFMTECPADVLEWVNKAIVAFGCYSASALSRWTHLPGSPWSKADSLTSLDDREIRLYFKPLLAKIESKAAGESNA